MVTVCPGPDQDGEVKHTVLLGADQFLAVDQQDALRRRIGKAQLGHMSALREIPATCAPPLPNASSSVR